MDFNRLRTLFFVIQVFMFCLIHCWAMSEPLVNKPDENITSGASPGDQSSIWSAKDIAFVLSPLLSLLGVGLIVYYTRKNTISEHWLKANQTEADYLQAKLDKFYGPYILIGEARVRQL